MAPSHRPYAPRALTSSLVPRLALPARYPHQSRHDRWLPPRENYWCRNLGPDETRSSHYKGLNAVGCQSRDCLWVANVFVINLGLSSTHGGGISAVLCIMVSMRGNKKWNKKEARDLLFLEGKRCTFLQ